LYKTCASQSGLKGAEVVAEIARLSDGEITVHETGLTIEETIADPITVEQPCQEEWPGVTHRVSLASKLAKTNSEVLNLVVLEMNLMLPRLLRMLTLSSTLRKMMKQKLA
jgi:hypothetical protein